MNCIHRKQFFVIVIFLLVVPFISAEDGPFGAGIVVGSDSGISLAWRLSANNTIQGSVGWNFSDSDSMSLTADYLFHFDDILTFDTITIPVYIGGGVRTTLPFSDDSGFTLGARIPVGIRWLFEEYPVEAFLEISPGLKLIPKTAAAIGFGLGARWYF
jgi:hypothetical protein